MSDNLKRSTELPEELDAEKLAAAALAILSLALHEGRLWGRSIGIS
jgi:hypothetical protein